MSILISASSSPKRASVRAFESSVFPTPVGPKNMKEPMGRLGSLSPTLPRRIAFATALTASSCPITRLWRNSSILRSLSLSSSASFLTGIPVQPEIISAMSSSPISPLHCSFLFFHSSLRESSFCCISFSLSRRSAAFSKSCAFMASFFSAAVISIALSSSFISGGAVRAPSLTRLHASSTRSIALSGRKRSVIYRLLIFAAATIALSEIFTP